MTGGPIAANKRAESGDGRGSVAGSESHQDDHPFGATGIGPGHENVIVGLLACAAGLVFLNRAGIAFLFPPIRAEFHLNNTQLGLLIAVTALTWGFSSVVFSFISDKLGGRPKLIIVACIIGFSVVGGLSGSIASFPALLALRGAMGVFEGPVIPLIQSFVGTISSPHRRGTNLGIIMAGATLIGGILAPVIMIELMTEYGWRSTFHVVALPGLVLAFAVALVMRPDTPAPSGIAAGHVSLKAVLSLLRRRNVALGLVGAITLISITATLFNFLPLFLHDRMASLARWHVAILTAFAVGSTAGTIIASALSDRIGRRVGLIIAVAALMLVPLGIVLAPLHAGFLVLPFLAYFVAGGAMNLMVFVIPGESVARTMVASTYALLLFIGELVGGAALPALAGYLSDRFDLSAAIWLCLLLTVMALLAALGVRDPSPDHGLSE